jgi:hypothetical protein
MKRWAQTNRLYCTGNLKLYFGCMTFGDCQLRAQKIYGGPLSLIKRTLAACRETDAVSCCGLSAADVNLERPLQLAQSGLQVQRRCVTIRLCPNLPNLSLRPIADIDTIGCCVKPQTTHLSERFYEELV